VSADLQKSLDTAIARIAQLEAEVSRSRAAKAEAKPLPAQLDPQAVARAIVADPHGTLTRMGVPTEHVAKVLMGNLMGDQAPPEWKVLAQMGPQMSATNALNSTVEQLRQRLDEAEARVARQSFQALAGDKQKYPHLAKAFAADPSLFEGDVAAVRGSAEEAAAALEARLSKMAAVIAPPPASSEDAATAAQSTQSKAQTTGGLDPTPPPIPSDKPGAWSEEEHRRIRDEVVRKHTSRQTPAAY
jgi:hypothetical protein